MVARLFEVTRHEFSNKGLTELHSNHFALSLWPMVYILSDGTQKQAYVGESTDILSRIGTHLKSTEKKHLTTIHLINSEKLNKSAALDIESNLIRYMAADGEFELLNGNLGLANHNYYQKTELYWQIFNEAWDDLRTKGIARHSLESINNSDIFKYSPYKALSAEQNHSLASILECLLDEKANRVLIEGGAGTGKTVLATFLFKMLGSDRSTPMGEHDDAWTAKLQNLVDQIKAKHPNPKMGLVVPMSSFRKTLQNIFKGIKGLNANMVIGPADVAKQQYDILIVDESHRLRRRVNLGAYFGAFDKASAALGFDKKNCNELDWILKQSRKTILFYDPAQSVKPSDTPQAAFDNLRSESSTKTETLKSQFRVTGGNAYAKFVDELLHNKVGSQALFEPKGYELTLFTSLPEMVEEIKARDSEHGLSRLIAGYSWPWVSNKNPDAFDIEIDDVKLRWNSTSVDWINKEGAAHEVGCIHTTQGYDLNYAGIIFGREIGFDPATGEIIIYERNYFDKNGKQSVESPDELKRFIINIYKTILMRGIKGAYVYACDPHLRAYLARHIRTKQHGSKAPIQTLQRNVVKPYENAIPLYHLNAAAGAFSEPQNVDDVAWISPPEGYRPSKQLFACKVVGESMNRIIPNGSTCLFRKDLGGSRNGKIVLVEHDSIHDADSGSRYTVKEYESFKTNTDGDWQHESIHLKPISNDPSYKKLVLTAEDTSTFKVIGIFECVI